MLLCGCGAMMSCSPEGLSFRPRLSATHAHADDDDGLTMPIRLTRPHSPEVRESCRSLTGSLRIPDSASSHQSSFLGRQLSYHLVSTGHLQAVLNTQYTYLPTYHLHIWSKCAQAPWSAPRLVLSRMQIFSPLGFRPCRASVADGAAPLNSCRTVVR